MHVRHGNEQGLVEVRLDQTAFYPEGGGQPSDNGTINHCPVTYVYSQEGILWHVVSASPGTFSSGGTVTGKINWQRRFDHMQQHLGQHILSAVFERYHQAKTIGFHLGEHNVTIDLDKGAFTQEQLVLTEDKANAIVLKNVSVSSEMMTEENALSLDVRKTPESMDNIRVVGIPETDLCACSGTHPGFTGEVGPIKIMKSEVYKGGCRITFLCGWRAIKSHQQVFLLANQTAAGLSVGWQELAETVKGLQQENKQFSRELKEIHQSWGQLKRDQLIGEAQVVSGVSLVLFYDEGMGFKQLTFLANAFREKAGTIALLGVLVPAPRFVLINTSQAQGVSMSELLTKSIHHIDGKGGGNASSAQGGGSRSDGLLPMLQEMLACLMEMLE